MIKQQLAKTYGINQERKAIECLETKINEKIENSGLLIDEELPFLEASPDGLIGTDEICEIKWPYNAKNMTIRQAVEQKNDSTTSVNFHRNNIYSDISSENEANGNDPIIGAEVTEENCNHVSKFSSLIEAESHVVEGLHAEAVLQIPLRERFIAGVLETLKVSPLSICSVVEFSFRYRKIQYSKWQKVIRSVLKWMIAIVMVLCVSLYQEAIAVQILAVIAALALIIIIWLTVYNYKAQNTDITDEERHFLITTYRATSNIDKSKENYKK